MAALELGVEEIEPEAAREPGARVEGRVAIPRGRRALLLERAHGLDEGLVDGGGAVRGHASSTVAT